MTLLLRQSLTGEIRADPTIWGRGGVTTCFFFWRHIQQSLIHMTYTQVIPKLFITESCYSIKLNLPDGCVFLSKCSFRYSSACGVNEVLRFRFFDGSLPIKSVRF